MTDINFLKRVSRELVDSGQPIAAGFMAARIAGEVPPDLTAEQLELARTMFMHGAQHLWGTIFGFLDDGTEPTESDERRMTIVAHELQAWYNQHAKRLGMSQQHAAGGNA